MQPVSTMTSKKQGIQQRRIQATSSANNMAPTVRQHSILGAIPMLKHPKLWTERHHTHMQPSTTKTTVQLAKFDGRHTPAMRSTGQTPSQSFETHSKRNEKRMGEQWELPTQSPQSKRATQIRIANSKPWTRGSNRRSIHTAPKLQQRSI